MSFILKALKKLEEEKSDQREGADQIARDILRSSRKTRRAENLILPIAVVALLLTGGMLAYFLAGGLGDETEEAVVVQSTEPAATEEKRPTMAEEAQADLRAQIAPEETKEAGTESVGEEGSALMEAARGDGENLAPISGKPAETTKEPVRAAQPVMAKRLSDPASPTAGTEDVTRNNREASAALKETARALRETAEALKEKVVFPREVVVMPRNQGAAPTAADVVSVRRERVAAGSARDAAGRQNIQVTYMGGGDRAENRSAIQRQGEAQPPEEPVVTGNVMTRSPNVSGGFPDLTVSEIHYQYDVKDRLAIVNDLPVMEGTLIDGARVDRILKDRVRFVYNGRYHEVRVE